MKQKNGSGTNYKTIRSRLTGVVVIPSVVLLVMWAVFSSYTIYDGVYSQAVATGVKDASIPAVESLVAIQKERETTLRLLARPGDDPVSLYRQQEETDKAVERMQEELRSLSEDAPPAVTEQVRRLEALLQELPVRRAQAESGRSAREVYDFYNSLLDAAAALFETQARIVPDAEGGQAGLTATELFRAADRMARATSLAGGALVAGGFSPEDHLEFTTLVGAYRAGLDAAVSAASPAVRDSYRDLTSSDGWAHRIELENELIQNGVAQRGKELPVTDDDWQSTSGPLLEKVVRMVIDQANEAVEVGLRNANAEFTRVLVGSLIALVAVLGGIVAALRISQRLVNRALITRLMALRDDSLKLAHERLPNIVERLRQGEHVDVKAEVPPLDYGKDEIGQVAEAFNAAQHTAVAAAVAETQAREGVNRVFLGIAHRNQGLVHRQLKILDRMEREEEDPERLDALFQLDHLATRARRNAENLIILAGEQPGRQWRKPIRLVDVLRAAIAETVQYERIRLNPVPPVALKGAAVADTIHLLAELLDNATNFSPPDSQVVMSTARSSDGSIVVEIVDQGVGMAEHELADANQRLGGPSSVDVSASRRMGLFVVGRLAARHGIGVRLSSSEGQGSGLTASVTVPAHLIPSIEPVEVSRTASLPLVTGGRAAVPPQRGVNGSAMSGGISALIAGTDGTANPTGVFDAPVGGDGQLFTPPPGQAAGGPPPSSLPSRRPGSTLRPGGPPGPPDGGDRGGVDPDEQAREVAAQARRDQEEAAARAAAARGEDQTAAPADAFERRNGHAVDFAGGVDQQKGADRKDADTDRDGQTGQQANGQVVQPGTPSTVSGLPRRTPGRAPGSSQPPADQAPAQPAQQQSAQQQSAQQEPAQQEPARPTDAKAEQAGADTAQPPRPAPSPRPAKAEQRTAEQDEAEQPGAAASAVSPPTMPMPAVRRTPQDSQPQSAKQQSAQQQSAQQQPTQQPAQQPEAEPAQAQQPAAQEQAAPAKPAAEEPARQQADDQQPAAAQGPTPQPAPRPTPRPTPRPSPQAAGQAEEQQTPAAQQQEPKASDADTLFAPNVPVISEPTAPSGVGSRPTGFDLGETTPIFEEIASAWFRSNRPIPVNYEQQNGTAKPQAGQGAQQPAATPQPTPRPAPSPRPTPPPTTEVPIASAPEPPQQPRPAPAEHEFATPADEGWRAASDVVSEPPDELTAAGLPKRRPRARLVPGSAGSSVLAPPAGATRSAEAIRGRLASYQQGIRQGRETRLRAQQHNGGTGPANAGGNHDEESS